MGIQAAGHGDCVIMVSSYASMGLYYRHLEHRSNGEIFFVGTIIVGEATKMNWGEAMALQHKLIHNHGKNAEIVHV